MAPNLMAERSQDRFTLIQSVELKVTPKKAVILAAGRHSEPALSSPSPDSWQPSQSLNGEAFRQSRFWISRSYPALQVSCPMAVRTESNQIGFAVLSQLTSGNLVVNLEVRHAPAPLAAPAVPSQNLVNQFAILLRVETNALSFRQVLARLVGLGHGLEIALVLPA